MAAVLLVAVNLRPGATSLGPVLQEVSEALGMDPATAGALTALPGLCFGVIGFFAVQIGRKLGLSFAIAVGMVLAAVGLLARPWMPHSTLFLLLSALALAGMAVGNVLVPAWVKRHGRQRTVMLMTLYSSFLTVGGSLGALLSAPMTTQLSNVLGSDHGWRWSLGFWGVIAVLPVVLWVLLARRTGHDFPPAPVRTERAVPLFKSPTALALTVLFGVQSMNAYVQFGWLPQVFRDAGMSASTGGAAVALIAGLGIIGGLFMPTVIHRARTLAPWMILFGLCTTTGYIGILFAPSDGVWLWSMILGIGGFAFPTAIAMIPARSRDPHVTARLSGFVQPFGYILAAIGPWAMGLVHTMTGDWIAVLIIMAASGIVMTLAGLRVSGRVMVDDELTVS